MMPAGEMDNGLNGSERNLMCEVFQTNLYSMSMYPNWDRCRQDLT